MDHVLWLGGGCESGKSSIARELAHRLDLQLDAVDAHGYDHHRRLGEDPGGHDERWLLPTPEQLADRFVRGSEERLALILDDGELRVVGGAGACRSAKPDFRSWSNRLLDRQKTLRGAKSASGFWGGPWTAPKLDVETGVGSLARCWSGGGL